MHGIRIAGIALASTALIVGVVPQQAQASTKTISVTVGDWNCRQSGQYKGSVSKVLIDAVPSNSVQPGWISGRTRAGISAIYQPGGSRVQIVFTAFCKTTWYGAGYYVYSSFDWSVDDER